MKNLFRSFSIFVLKSVIAGLALAFVLLYFYPDLLPEQQQNFNMRNSTSPMAVSSGPISYNQAVALSAPSVVNVYATKIRRSKINPLFQDPLFRRYFGDQGATAQRATNLGSGVIMNSEGIVITNTHIINEADEIGITLADGRQTVAEVIGIDKGTDIAVLRINLDKLPVISIGNSDNLQVGDIVLAIGNPYDFGQTVTQGIISAIGRNRLGISTYENFIQTDADINPGNSGGALINASGKMIGINTAIYSPSGGSQGIGFAIPVNVAVDVMQSLIEYGHVIRGWLGIEAQVVPSDITSQSGAPQTGVLVAGILQNGPADTAGIIPGDIIIEVNGIPVDSPYQAIQLIGSIPPGTAIEVIILRGWQQLTVEAVVTQRPE
jgi:serine protease DegS